MIALQHEPAPLGPHVGRVERWEALGDSIALSSALLDAGAHTLLTQIREFDAEGAWGHQGARSMAHWLNWRTGLSLKTGRARVRVARALGTFTIIDEALRRGLLSYSKVRAMIRVATPENEGLLVNLARAGTAEQLEKTCRGVRTNLRSPYAESQKSYVSLWPRDDGRTDIKGILPAETAALLKKSLDAAKRDAYRKPSKSEGECSKTEQKSASAEASADAPKSRFTNLDALRAVASTYLSVNQESDRTPGRYEVLLHVDIDALAGRPPSASKLAPLKIQGGQALSLETARRITCDAPRVVVLVDGSGKTLDVGRRRRTIPPALYRALLLRDGGCAFPGCTNHLFVEAHHVVHWANGGETKLSNLILLCWAHHRDLHENGFTLVIALDGTREFRDPKKRVIAHAPQPPPVPEPAMAALAAAAMGGGLKIHPYTAIPGWDGGNPDYDVMISGLLDGKPAGWDPLMEDPWR